MLHLKHKNQSRAMGPILYFKTHVCLYPVSWSSGQQRPDKEIYKSYKSQSPGQKRSEEKILQDNGHKEKKTVKMSISITSSTKRQ